MPSEVDLTDSRAEVAKAVIDEVRYLSTSQGLDVAEEWVESSMTVWEMDMHGGSWSLEEVATDELIYDGLQRSVPDRCIDLGEVLEAGAFENGFLIGERASGSGDTGSFELSGEYMHVVNWEDPDTELELSAGTFDQLSTAIDYFGYVVSTLGEAEERGEIDIDRLDDTAEIRKLKRRVEIDDWVLEPVPYSTIMARLFAVDVPHEDYSR
jgi:hypothetical protein